MCIGYSCSRAKHKALTSQLSLLDQFNIPIKMLESSNFVEIGECAGWWFIGIAWGWIYSMFTGMVSRVCCSVVCLMWTLWVVFCSDAELGVQLGLFVFGMPCFSWQTQLGHLFLPLYQRVLLASWGSLGDYSPVFIICLAFEYYVLTCLEFFIAWAGGGFLYIVCL